MGREAQDGKGLWTATVRRCSHPLVVLLVAAVIRLTVAVVGFERLKNDPDSYRQLAETLAQTGVYARPDPVDGKLYPTAYRPPLYPLVLAGFATAEGVSRAAIAVLHLLLGVGTVALTLRIGQRLGLGTRAALAGLLVAADPILLHQATLVMTETFAACLAAGGLTCVIEVLRHPGMAGRSWGWRTVGWTVSAGVVAGLAALCRPTFLPWLPGLAVLVGGGHWLAAGRRPSVARSATLAVVLFCSGLLVVAPWAFRNRQQMGQWIATTTHGGYTLLLGNNPDYYAWLGRPSADGVPWQLPSDDYLMERCRESLEPAKRQAHSRLRGVGRELAEDELARRCAAGHIVARPAAFFAASLWRLGQFWSPLPNATAAEESGPRRAARYAIAAWYAVVGWLAVRGFGRWLLVGWGAVGSVLQGRDGVVGGALPPRTCRRIFAWCPLAALVVCFAAAHTVYWSNLRMRGPVMPAVCLWAAAGVGARALARVAGKSGSVSVGSGLAAGVGVTAAAGAEADAPEGGDRTES